MNGRVLLLQAAVVTTVLGLAAQSLLAQDHSAAGELRIGMSAAFSGPNKSLGKSMRRGIEACIERVNAEGGVHGRRLRLIALDDGYEPTLAATNMVRLLDDEGVVAVLGNVGTPTAAVTVPIALDRKVLLLGALTGSGLLRQSPPDRYVINHRASYAEETGAMIDGLLKAGIRPQEIAFFTQDDAYGDAGYEGALAALESHGFHGGGQLVRGRYTRNTVDVEEGVLAVLKSEIRPRAIIMVGTYAPCAKFIRITRPALPFTYFLNVSFVSGAALAVALDGESERVIVTEIVPHHDSELPMCADYRRDYRRAFPEEPLGFVSLEGYVVARTLVQGLRIAGTDVTRESLVDAIESIQELDSGLGVPVRFSATEHQGCHAVWPMMRIDGEIVPVVWEELKHADTPRPDGGAANDPK